MLLCCRASLPLSAGKFEESKPSSNTVYKFINLLVVVMVETESRFSFNLKVI